MKIIGQKPPNYDEILHAFPAIAGRDILFCYGDTIYIPTGNLNVMEPLLKHEMVHSKQQNGQPAEWWRRYIRDKDFRCEQEVEAHCMEYIVGSANLTRNQRRLELRFIAQKFCEPIYGWYFSVEQAKKMIARAEHAHR